jgi:hypothetical protein
MANSDADHLEALKTARDAIVAGMQAGRLTITYQIGGRLHTVSDPVMALRNLEQMISQYQLMADRGNRSPFRPARISRAGGTE